MHNLANVQWLGAAECVWEITQTNEAQVSSTDRSRARKTEWIDLQIS